MPCYDITHSLPCYDINITDSENVLYLVMTLTLHTQIMFYTLL